MHNAFSLTRRLNLEQAEGYTLSLLSLSLLVVIGATSVIGRTVGRSLFLSALPLQFIPFRYLAVTTGVVLASLLYNRLAGSFQRDRLIRWTTLAMIIGLLIFRVLLNTSLADSLWMLGGFYVFLEITMSLTIVQFWTFASDLVNTRQAKRMFPIINAAGNFGSLLAGAAVTILVVWLGTLNMLFIMMGLLAVYILLVERLGRGNTHQIAHAVPAKTADKMTGSLIQSLQITRRVPLLGIMLTIIVLVTLATNIVDYQFDLTLKSSFSGNSEGLSSFLGSFYFWTGIAALVVQLFISGPVLQRFGLSAALLLLPLGFLAGSAVVLATGAALWAVTLTRSSDAVFRYTAHDTAISLLYIPIDRQSRAQARSLIDGVIKPLLVGLAGLSFFLVNHFIGIIILPWSIAIILIVLLLGLTLLRLRPVYLQTLNSSIRRHYLDLDSEAINLNDRNTVAAIQTTLQSSDESQLLNALALAEDIHGIDWTQSLLPLLENKSPLVRRQAVRMLRQPESSEYYGLVHNLFKDPDVMVQAAAVFTYWAMLGEQALNELTPFMHHPLPQVQSAAISGALCYGGKVGEQAARPIFEAMVKDARPPVRAAAAYAIRELSSDFDRQLLICLLDDPDPQVRLQAIESATYIDDPRLIPLLISQLGDPMTGVTAGEALVRFGSRVFPYLDAFYGGESSDLNVRRVIPPVVARISDAQSVQLLMRHLDETDDLARARVYIALGRLSAAGFLPTSGLIAIADRFMDEIHLAYHWASLSVSLQLAKTGDLLEDALFWQRRYALDRVLYLISILYTPAKIEQVRASLYGSDLRQRANAIEILDNLLSRQHKELVLPLLEGTPEQILSVARRIFNLSRLELQSAYALLVEGTDTWLEICALQSLAYRRLVELARLVRHSLHSPDGLVRETALFAARQIFPTEEYQNAIQEYIAQESSSTDYSHTQLFVLTGSQEGGMTMPITTIERILLLRGVELFKEIPGQELELIARLCSEVHFAPGERFICQDEQSDCLYILVDGEVQVTIDGIGVVGMRRGRDVIGEIGVLANSVRNANCTAVQETSALRIDQTDFWDLLEWNGSLSVAVIRVLLPRLLEATAANVQARYANKGVSLS